MGKRKPPWEVKGGYSIAILTLALSQTFLVCHSPDDATPVMDSEPRPGHSTTNSRVHGLLTFDTRGLFLSR